MRWLCQCFAHKHSNSAVVPSAPGICISHQMCWLWVHARGGGLLLFAPRHTVPRHSLCAGCWSGTCVWLHALSHT